MRSMRSLGGPIETIIHEKMPGPKVLRRQAAGTEKA